MVTQTDPPPGSQTPYFAPTYFPVAYFFSGDDGDDSSGANPGRTPYNAPTYFPPAYFYGGGPADANPTEGRTPYNAPTYFPSTYFYGGLAASDPVSAPSVRFPGRDGGSFAALIDLLRETGALDSVVFGDPTRRSGSGANTHPLAIVTPRGWEEADDVDPTLLVRRVMFTIRLVIRVDDDDESPFDQLDQLAAVVQARVDQSDLNGQCLAPLTKIRAGRYQATSQYPEWSIDLDGEFTSLVDPSALPTLV